MSASYKRVRARPSLARPRHPPPPAAPAAHLHLRHAAPHHPARQQLLHALLHFNVPGQVARGARAHVPRCQLCAYGAGVQPGGQAQRVAGAPAGGWRREASGKGGREGEAEWDRRVGGAPALTALACRHARVVDAQQLSGGASAKLCQPALHQPGGVGGGERHQIRRRRLRAPPLLLPLPPNGRRRRRRGEVVPVPRARRVAEDAVGQGGGALVQQLLGQLDVFVDHVGRRAQLGQLVQTHLRVRKVGWVGGWVSLPGRVHACVSSARLGCPVCPPLPPSPPHPPRVSPSAPGAAARPASQPPPPPPPAPPASKTSGAASGGPHSPARSPAAHP